MYTGIMCHHVLAHMCLHCTMCHFTDTMCGYIVGGQDWWRISRASPCVARQTPSSFWHNHSIVVWTHIHTLPRAHIMKTGAHQTHHIVLLVLNLKWRKNDVNNLTIWRDYMLTMTLIFENIICWRIDFIEDAYDFDNVDDDNDDD